MSDASIDLHATNPAEHIPAALAAPKPKRAKAQKAEAPADQPAHAPAAEPVSVPTAAAPADTEPKETTMATTIENATDTHTNKAEALFGDMNARAKGAMEKGAAMFAELNSFNKGNVEALVESGKIAFAGFQTMAQDQAAYVRTQFEQATANARTLTSVKSPTEFAKLQGDYVRQQFDAMVAETSRSTEAMLKLAGEIVQPISNRFAIVADRIKTAA